MRTLIIVRGKSTDQGTPGILIGPPNFYSLELPWRGNARRLSCIPPTIPPGVYPVIPVITPRHGKVYNVQNVPGRDSILIHSGNSAGDVTKGLESDVLGCILLGKYRGTRRGQMVVLASKFAIGEFERAMEWQRFMLEIKGG